MNKKTRAAQVCLVAAFLAAGGTAAANAEAATSPAIVSQDLTAPALDWGDPLIRFLKLDGFSAYLKYEDSAQLAMYYKVQIISDVAVIYNKYPDQVAELLALYQKADAGPLTGILMGLETYFKEDNIEPLLDYLKTPGATDAYLKFEDFFRALQSVSGGTENGGAFQLFFEETGISGLPAVQYGDGGGEIG